jgi:hypothetical protein
VNLPAGPPPLFITGAFPVPYSRIAPAPAVRDCEHAEQSTLKLLIS